jgi:hypothetical protein
VITPSVPPLPHVDVAVPLGDSTFDVRWRALVAAVIPPPAFGGEGEVVARVRAAGQAGADLAVVSLPPVLIGPAARARVVPIAARASSPDAAADARRAGARLLLLAPGGPWTADHASELAAEVAAELPAHRAAVAEGVGWTAAVLVDEVADIEAARAVAEHDGLVLAIDTSRRTPADALAIESAAIPAGCRVVCTADVRRTRRVVEVVAALLATQREVPTSTSGAAHP